VSGSFFFRFSNLYLTETSIPFFFEPNFTAEIAPLEAVRRIQEDSSCAAEGHHTSKQVRKVYEPTIYGDFLRNKVRNNFAYGAGKYD